MTAIRLVSRDAGTREVLDVAEPGTPFTPAGELRGPVLRLLKRWIRDGRVVEIVPAGGARPDAAPDRQG